jgi:cysteine desulfurase/selenocysteine lyase
MPTTMPDASGSAAAPAAPPSPPSQPTPPAGLPDAATLAQWAGELFSRLPGSAHGGVPVPANPLPPGVSLPPGTGGPATPTVGPVGAAAPGANLVPSNPQNAAAFGASAPSLRPHAVAPNGLPDTVTSTAPGYDGRLGSQALGAPGFTTAPVGGVVPSFVASDLPSPTLDQGHGRSPAQTPAQTPAHGLPAPASERPEQPHRTRSHPADYPAAGPGVDNRSLPAARAGDARHDAHPGAHEARPHGGAPPSGSSSPFYFLDQAGPPKGAPTGSPFGSSTAYDARHDAPHASGDDSRGGSGAHGPTESPFYFLTPLDGHAARGHAGPGADRPWGQEAGGDPRRAQAIPTSHPPFDVHAVRRDFPILQERVHGRPLVWFDNAATTHKPQVVIDRLAYFYAHENSNIHRAAHELAARATDAYEKARETVRRFIGAGSVDEIVFVRGTTEAINLVAKSWGVRNVHEGDEIIVSHLEHHANIVPWQQLASQKGAKLRVIPVDDSGQVLLDEYQKLLNDRTKIVAVTQVSNALGTVVPVKQIVELARRAGVCTLVDGAQSVSHMRVDVRALDTDFFVFSGHKIFGPTGIGVVYGKKAVLDAMPPWQGGGNMIADVTFEKTVYHGPPTRFEAGTGNIADAVGLGAALEYVERLGIETIGRYEHDLLDHATHALRPVRGVRLVGTAKYKASVLSFVLEGYTTEEVGKALNQEGIAVRTGHHCAQPILRRFGLETTVRPSLAFYNTVEEVDRMIAVVQRLARR